MFNAIPSSLLNPQGLQFWRGFAACPRPRPRPPSSCVCPSCFGGVCAIYCFYAFVVHFLVVASALLDCQLSARTDWHKFCASLGCTRCTPSGLATPTWGKTRLPPPLRHFNGASLRQPIKEISLACQHSGIAVNRGTWAQGWCCK